ncbi:hormogonium polysaccharide biosynthesis protein HpsA [Myxacorys almedinensis]|uniref:Uncharacterized protein n=1 Tax=Myxacorys almedinensis A TaxID=2690445 RepID=A0A8J7YX60_9CYAN|nr:hormogonium polysaccharide biosynthesis protein HpsA [Myxacorys almedinensis]NDJ16267.1 hypothetical protein [Myxacorys almedinensis A]
MSHRKLAQAIQGLFRQVRRLYRSLTKSFVNWLLRSALINQHQGKVAPSGFVLPTTVLLVLVVSLTVGALTFRAYNRNTQVIGEAQQRVIYNAATPAVDRARSKMEFLFDPTRDTRYPGGVPSEELLYNMLLNDGSSSIIKLPVKDKQGNLVEAYDLSDETRIDLNGDGKKDNAWSFRTDTDSDGKADATVVYSIALRTPYDPEKPKKTINEQLVSLSDKEKANFNIKDKTGKVVEPAAIVVRHGPLSNDLKAIGCTTTAGNSAPEGGWFEDSANTSILRKNFQVDALVIPDAAKSTAVTLEMHQDRQINRGNKWGAWFRNDLEIYPGPTFNWNGAMHTEGSLIVGGSSGKFNAHLISAKNSCVYEPASNSDITVTSYQDNNSQLLYQGVAIAGAMKTNTTAGSVAIYIHGPKPENSAKTLNSGSDAAKNNVTPINVSIDPKKVLTEDGYTNRSQTNNSTLQDWNNLKTKGLGERIKNVSEKAPYVDDLYRADDRWGPKYKYDDNKDGQIPAGKKVGDDIVGDQYSRLTLQNPPSLEQSSEGVVGLDGYWERRARSAGLRILVGERLELGNLNTWFAPQNKNGNDFIESGETEGDPLYPPTVKPYPVASSGTTVKHVDLQRRSLRDNVSAVQSTAVYHFNVEPKNPDYPVACLATTAHPGTPTTLRQSINFIQTQFAKGGDPASPENAFLLTNFFTGQGTNGWEFNPPANDAAAFELAMNSDSPLRKALTNLASFAGDPDGAYPPKSDDKIHPYPALTMWGNFSNLRRTLGKLEGGTQYANLSIADKTYLHTAACTLGSLAYTISQLQQFDPSNPNNDFVPSRALTPSLSQNGRVLSDLAGRLFTLMDGEIKTANGGDEVLPKSQLSTYGYKENGIYSPSDYNAKDYYNVPPEVFIGVLKRQIAAVSGSDVENDPRIRLAEMIMLHHQIRRDRTFGFRPSPAFGEYVVKYQDAYYPVFPTACDPDEFTFGQRVGGADPFQGNGDATDPDLKIARGISSVKLADGSREDASNLAKLSQKELGKYRLALSRLCGTVDTRNYEPGNPAKQATVLPKFPSLHYIFPEKDHTLTGAIEDIPGSSLKYDYRQPDGTSLPGNPDPEPYITDAYVKTLVLSKPFRQVDAALPGTAGTNRARFRTFEPQTPASAIPISNISANINSNGINGSLSPTTSSSRPYFVPDTSAPPAWTPTIPFPIEDYSVEAVALQPKKLNDWTLPKMLQPDLPSGSYSSTFKTNGPTKTSAPNFPTNFIVTPDANDPTNPNKSSVTAVPFLDRAFFDGRQYLLTRSLDIDLGMLRNNLAGTQNVWLPESGVVYAFREDAIREDAIKRPDAATGMDVRNLAETKDPSVDARGISTKAIDFLPDPDRRSHGFRLRNGAQVKRKDGLIDTDKNIRGLSFFTDQPVYIQGDFNLHQDGTDDTAGVAIEEFKQKLPASGPYTAQQFYNDRVDRDDSFAKPNIDRWRPSEILADSITILSSAFCDGSVADSFVLPATIQSSPFKPDYTISTNQSNIDGDRRVYNKAGLYGPGCPSNGRGSFNNQNRPKSALQSGRDWMRENSSPYTYLQRNLLDLTGKFDYWTDFTSPIKISRVGQPLVVDAQAGLPLLTSRPATPTTVPPTNTAAPYPSKGGNYIAVDEDNTARLMTAQETRINSIVVSGIHPSREKQGYGGLHNFPRFLENWGSRNLFFAGSFLQLNFSNYATAPFETETWEPPAVTTGIDNESIPYYSPPNRLWGYDVALQLSPAGPAAARFVTSGKDRSEFYSEPPVNDPYIAKLCKAVKNSTGLIPSGVTVNCPGS